MKKRDLDLLVAFTKRPGMYMHETSPESIDLFLMTYHLARRGKCNFKQDLIEFIFDKYAKNADINNLKNKNMRILIDQIKILAASNNTTWKEAYQSEAMELLIKLSDDNGKNKYAGILRKRLKIQLSTEFNKREDNWQLNYLHVVRQIKEWKGIGLSNDENELLHFINDTLRTEQKKTNGQILEFSPEVIQNINKLKSLVSSYSL